LSSEDFLILGVALIVVLNRLYAKTGLRRHRAAYATVQAINLGACIVLFVKHLEGVDPRLDAGIRLFLSAFVTWHIAQNFISHGKRLRELERERRRAAAEEDIARDLREMATEEESVQDSG
jgi:hypothetical protein